MFYHLMIVCKLRQTLHSPPDPQFSQQEEDADRAMKKLLRAENLSLSERRGSSQPNYRFSAPVET